MKIENFKLKIAVRSTDMVSGLSSLTIAKQRRGDCFNELGCRIISQKKVLSIGILSRSSFKQPLILQYPV